MKNLTMTVVIFSLTFMTCNSQEKFQRPEVKEYPASTIVDQTDVYHNIEVEDPYRWLENLESDEVRNWMQAQDSFASSFIDTLSIRQAVLNRYNAIRNIKPGRISGVPRKAVGKYFFYSRKLEPVGIYVSESSQPGTENLLYSLEAISKLGEPDQNMRLVEFEPSPDGKYLAFGIANGGSQWNTWYILDVANRKLLDDQLDGMYLFYSKISWKKDSQGFVYNGFQVPQGSDMQTPTGHQIRYHRVGTSQDADAIIYEDLENPGWIFSGDVSNNGKHFVFTSLGREVNNVYYKKLDSEEPVAELVGGRSDRYIYIGSIGDDLYFATSKNSPNLRVVKININEPEYENWVELVPERDYAINTAVLVGGKLVIEYLKDVSPQLEIHTLNGELETRVKLPYIGGWLVSRRSTGFMNGVIGNQNDDEAFFGMNGQTDPGSIYRLNTTTGEITVYSKPELAFNPGDYTTEQVFYNSKDGTKVPMFIVYKNGLKKNANTPAWLYAYGYNFPSTLYYVGSIMTWLDMGGIYAYPGIRGGSDYGINWIKAGAARNKQNAIDDYIYAARYLIEAGYTTADKLIANGGSASGPLPAAAIIQEPSLFGLAYIDIPLLDMVRMYDFISQIITTGWGSIENKEDFEALYAWSPYHNVKPANYPPTIITPGEKDQMANPLHAYKFTAALQNAQKDNTSPILLQIAWGAGHATTRRTEINQLAFAAYWFQMKVE